MNEVMKRIVVLLIIMLLAKVGWSQTMTINFKDGSFSKHSMSDIESIVFSEDENTDDIHSTIVGTWQTISVEGWGMEVKVDEIDYLQIKSDGNYIHVEWENNAPYVSKGKWTLANNKFTIKESEGDNVGAAYVYDLAIINSDKITMTMWDAKATLIRVSDSVMDKYINK